MQQFLSDFTVIAGPISYKHLTISKNYDLTTFMVAVSPPVMIKHHRLLFL